FYDNLGNNKKPDKTITNYLISGERTFFNEELASASSNCGDSRLVLITTTLDNFDEILEEENYYYINFSAKFKNKHEIKKEFEKITNRKTQLYSMLVEYNIKCENGTNFNKQIGANDLYDSFANFFKEYSDFIQFFNNKIRNNIPSAVSDVKFSVIELYTLVVKDSFSIIIKEDELKTIPDAKNINYMNSIIDFENGQLNTQSYYFGSNSTNFMINFDTCDKTLFAKNLYDYLDSVAGNVNDMTSIERASYYFKEIFGF
ncbi:MAG: hypothetical protein IKA36_00800, partial [Clostridia bacterium]|nr:hypothetical protein [Clostridia bacterium]